MRLRSSLVLIGILCAGCAAGDVPLPNVALIAVDTLRTDRLSFYGCTEINAPFLNELAGRSLLFENAWSTSSWTLPAAVSAITSVYPFQHGVNNLVGLELGSGDEPVPVNCIPGEVETLAETLRAAGYRTFGIVSNVLVGSEVGFDRGFDRFIKLEDDDAEVVNSWVEKWRDEMLVEDQPFFLYVHYFDPHDTLHARAPWFDPSHGRAAQGWPGGFPEQVRDTFNDLDWLTTRLAPRPEWLGERRTDELSPQELEDLLAWMRAAYDSEISYLDSNIADMYASLSLDEAIVFFLADHGEEFYEHGYITHGQNLYHETVRVPLLLRAPGASVPSGRVAENVSTLDIVPTLRSLLGLPPSRQDRGHDLLLASKGRPIVSQLAGKSGQHALDGDMSSIVLDGHKLIVGEGGATELYDLSIDPLERSDLSARLPEVVTHLRDALERELAGGTTYPQATRIPEAPSAAMLEHLQGIGYTGGD